MATQQRIPVILIVTTSNPSGWNKMLLYECSKLPEVVLTAVKMSARRGGEKDFEKVFYCDVADRAAQHRRGCELQVAMIRDVDLANGIPDKYKVEVCGVYINITKC